MVKTEWNNPLGALICSSPLNTCKTNPMVRDARKIWTLTLGMELQMDERHERTVITFQPQQAFIGWLSRERYDGTTGKGDDRQ